MWNRKESWRSKEKSTKIDINEEIQRVMKELQCTSDVTDLNYEDLCIHLNLDLSEGFKIQKFDTFGVTGNFLAHLRVYCDQLVGVGGDKVVLMRLFRQSLSREALK